jgi:hypothetical protein
MSATPARDLRNHTAEVLGPQRGQDPLGEELPVGLAAGPLHDEPGQQKGRAAVVPQRAWLGAQRRGPDDLQPLADTRRLGWVQARGIQDRDERGTDLRRDAEGAPVVGG